MTSDEHLARIPDICDVALAEIDQLRVALEAARMQLIVHVPLSVESPELTRVHRLIGDLLGEPLLRAAVAEPTDSPAPPPVEFDVHQFDAGRVVHFTGTARARHKRHQWATVTRIPQWRIGHAPTVQVDVWHSGQRISGEYALTEFVEGQV